MMKSLSAAIALGTVMLVAGCGSGSSGTGQTGVTTPATSVSVEALRAAPTQVSVGAKSYTLNAFLFRNYMPMVTPDGTPATHPLNASFTVTSTDSSSIPAGLTVSAAWVVDGSTVGAFTSLSPTISTSINAASTLTVPNDSTNFAPGSKVEVVVQVKAADGTTYLLQQADVPVSAAS